MANEFLQEIKITELNTPPAIGSTQEPNVIWIVPISDKVCDIYTSDNNGLVRATSVQTPIFNSVEEANATIPITNRFDCKEVLIKDTYSQEITNADGETQTITGETYTLYWWKGGIENENLKLKSFGLEAVLSNGNRLPAGQKFVFTNAEDVGVPKEFWDEDDVEVELHTGGDGTNIVFARNIEDQQDEGALFYGNVILDTYKRDKLKKAVWGTTIVGFGCFENAVQSIAGSIAMGQLVFKQFTGVNPTQKEYQDYGAPWGKVSNNIGIGYWTGKHLENGGGNVFIGSCADVVPYDNAKYEMWNMLIIHNHHSFTGLDKWKEEGTVRGSRGLPLIVGKFDERWFELNGKLRLRPQYNKIEAVDLSKIDGVLVRSTSKGEVEIKDKNELLKAVLLSDEITFTEEEQNILKTKLGIA